jgi:hypothetical protein
MLLASVTRRRFAAGLLGAAALVALASVPTVAREARAAASKGPKLEILTIHATKNDGGVEIEEALKPIIDPKREPFTRYNVYKTLDKKLAPFEQDRPVTYPIVNGRTLQVTLLKVDADKPEKRYHVRAAIDREREGRRAYLKTLEVTAGANETFFVAGQSYENGKLFLGLTVRQ